MVRHLLTVNPGSSTLKLGMYRLADGHVESCCRGLIDLHASPPMLTVRQGSSVSGHTVDGDLSMPALAKTLAILMQAVGAPRIDAVGHRIVHGGDSFNGPALIDDTVVTAITGLIPLAPLHQPQSVRLIDALRQLLPGIQQTASFDTAFHHHQAALTRRLPLPRSLFDAGIKRYGFHGLSYSYIASTLHRSHPHLANGRVVVAHLGSGASLCALNGGRSQSCSMGFSTLDGIPMATRSGCLDPGIILHLLKQKALSLNEIEEMLYHRSGLLGLSGLSGDLRELLTSPRPEAQEAIASFNLRVAQEVAAQSVMLGGLDGIVFTAGIGEHQHQIRAGIIDHLAWLGLTLNYPANTANATCISSAASRVQILIIPTDEEQIIAEEAAGLLS